MPSVAQAEPKTETTLSPLYRIVIHNDDATPMDYVVRILQEEFERKPPDARRIMWLAHETGSAEVMTCGREEAERRIGRAHSRARAAGYPLTFTAEPA